MSRSNEWIRTFCNLHRQIKSMRESLRGVTETHELSDTEATLLFLCADDASAGLPQRGLATLTAMSPAAVSGHLESLRQKNLIVSARDVSDRRRQTWSATSAGHRLVDEIARDLSCIQQAKADTALDAGDSPRREAA